ncbi:DNA-binding transcriptional LysR family regulator [Xanthomonas campestris]|uniref:LysR family transcriptional regulator n=1 Tax=Xanthomonas sp. CFBP 8151 TaxID=3035310 RepID=UPI00141B26C4|nr:LysR family transcriptional regulator [Xanthomonas sp. CFBP 8151]NIJ78638.1 DNA-binding transcriptional LysR family regulator [Xanthomonas sp. CFBP 8151]
MEAIPEFNLRHLAAVPTIHRRGSIAAALDEVNLSQPALTQALARLERLVDQPLFDRHPGGMVATPAGQLLVARIERALAYLAQGVQRARRLARLPGLPAVERRVTLPQLRALIAVEAAGSYSLAAVRSGVSQPAVYRAVQELSTLIGVTLFNRQGKTVQPTLAATRLLRFVRLALAELSAAMDELHALRAQGAGRIAVGTLPLARAVLLPQVLARFARAFPAASVNVAEGSYAELLAHLREGSLDVLIGATRHPPPVTDIVQEVLFDDEPVLVARCGHPLVQAECSIDALLTYPWVMPARGAPMRERWERMFNQHGYSPPPLRVESGSVLVMRGLLLEDDWLTMMSRDQFLFEQRAGLLCELPFHVAGGRRQIGLTMRSDWHPTTVQRAFVENFRQACAQRRDGVPAWPFRHLGIAN